MGYHIFFPIVVFRADLRYKHWKIKRKNFESVDFIHQGNIGKPYENEKLLLNPFKHTSLHLVVSID